ncbi:hypothetical protein EXU85_10570 [Spirosoma sp. KCTC 42546]|uniref:hypothetical protein n=1 Tax=Spirosoma sp. KCTC 42546 TaxID=2520506 RepID=UPI001157A86C|nr:hypothetical protein [Spirosoma sp. KCTC 42546]QDK79027.1 hypothetical protein EXU85_10570 [Spirosoma sp. KCTC 42546]
MRIILISVIPVLILVGCARQPTLTAELVPRSLKAVNLEETISRRDELMMAYSLTSYDANNKPVAVVNGGWGVETVRKDEQLDLRSAASPEHNPAKPISLALPRNGRIVASVVLIEVDDYNQAKETISKIQKIHNIVAIPIGLLLTVTEVLTPLKYVSAGLVASGVGLQLVDKLDDDDLLGQSSVDLREADLRQKKQRLVHVPAVFTGQNMKDAFDYGLEYDIQLKAVKIQPVRQ